MKILLISDVHYGEDIVFPKDMGSDRIANFGRNINISLQKLKSVVETCDLVVNLGDLIQQTNTVDGDSARYTEAMKWLDLGKPVKHVIGNHDLVNMKRPSMAKLIGESNIFYTFDCFGYHHVVLDGNREGKSWPEPFRFDLEQIKWLENDLASATLPVIVYSHYPIAFYNLDKNPLFRVLGKSMAFPQKSEVVKNILENSHKVLAVLSGHMHFSHQQIKGGIHHVVLGSFSRNVGYEKATRESDRPSKEYSIVTLSGKDIWIENKFL